MPEERPVAQLWRMSRGSRWDLAFWAVLVVFQLVALVRAVARDDAERMFLAGAFMLTAAFWLVRTWWSRRDDDGQAASPSPALTPPRLWIAGGSLLLAGLIALPLGSARLGAVLVGLAVFLVLPLALDDHRRRQGARQPR